MLLSSAEVMGRLAKGLCCGYPLVVSENTQDLLKWAAFIVIFGVAVWLQRRFFGRGKGK